MQCGALSLAAKLKAAGDAALAKLTAEEIAQADAELSADWKPGPPSTKRSAKKLTEQHERAQVNTVQIFGEI